MQSILDELGIGKNNVVNELYKVPKKDKGVNAPKFQPIKPGYVIQSDLLYLPNDNGKKYALVCCDNGSRLIDAEPISNKESATIVKAFEAIFKRGILKKPKKFEVDSGTEFQGQFLAYAKKIGAKVRVAEVGRSRQQALVEKVNQILGTLILKRQSAQELLTGATSREWVSDLKKIIPLLNKHRASQLEKQTKKAPPIKDAEPLCEGDACNLLHEFDKVRVMLESPIRVSTGKKEIGRFRSGDIRWDPKIRTIRAVIIKPNMPPLYVLDGEETKWKITPVGYTKAQLQLVREGEKQPEQAVVRERKNTQYTVEKLVRRFKEKGKIFFEIKWKNYPASENTNEPRSSLIKQVPDLVLAFEQSN